VTLAGATITPMKEKHDLPDWSYALAPVTHAQLGELRRFESLVTKLYERTFFDSTEHTLRFAWEEGTGPIEFEPVEPSEEQLLAALPTFRQLYNTANEPGSAARVINILQRSAHQRGSDDGRKLIAILKGHKKCLANLRADNGGLKYVHNGKSLTFGDVIDLWVNGEYLHHDPEKAAVLDTAYSDFLAFQLRGAVVSHGRCYRVLANVVTRCIEEPALSASATG
jgi:hypothetical protein